MQEFIYTGIFLSVIVEYLSFYRFIFRPPIREVTKKESVTAIGIVLAIGGLNVCLNIYELSMIFGYFVSYILLCMWIKCGWQEILRYLIVDFLTLSIMGSLAEHFLVVIMNIRGEQVTLYANLVLIAGLYILFLGIGRKLPENAFEISRKIWPLFSGTLMVLMLMISLFTYMSKNSVSVRLSGIGMLLTSVGGVIICVIYYLFLYYFNQKEELQFRLKWFADYSKQQKEHYELILQKEEETKKFRHEIVNHLLQIDNYVGREEYDKASDYVKQLTHNIRNIRDMEYDVGNSVINTLFNYYLQPIKNKARVIVNSSHRIGEIKSISDCDLCVIIANVVKNAVDALENISIEKRIIQIDVQRGKQHLKINVKNTVRDDIKCLDGDFLQTTKDDIANHGYGIQNVKTIVRKNQGFYRWYIQDGYFVTEIILKI